LDFNKNDITNEIPIHLTFITNSGKKEDKALLPIHSTAKDILEKIENDQEDKDSMIAMRVFYKGKEMNKNSETIEKLGIFPFAKLLIVTALGKPYACKRFSLFY